MSDSEDDKPLMKKPTKTPSRVSDAMDHEITGRTNGHTAPGISLMNGPVENGQPHKNGVQKRKARVSYKQESESDDDVPLNKRLKTKPAAPESDDDDDDVPLAKTGRMPPKATAKQIGEDSDSDTPLGQKLQKQKASIEAKAEKEAKVIRSKEHNIPKKKRAIESDSDDAPIASKRLSSAKAKKPNGVKKEDSEDNTPLKKAPAIKKAKSVKTETASSVPSKRGKKGVKSEEPDEEEQGDGEEEYNWWDDPTKGDGTKKWDTLQHNGVVFPPAYEPLPKNVKMRYDGVPVSLPPESEEVATFFGSMLNSTHNVENPTFVKNFFHDFRQILDKTGHGTGPNGEKVKMTKFEKCDFKPIFEHFDSERMRKKNLSTAEKKAIKAEKDEAEVAYTHCVWDGRKQKVGNFRVEPPGLFRGRGEHPKTGHVKQRVQPEQITINIGEEATVPAPPEGHRWKEVKHDKEGTWLAMWQENINGNYKYVMLAANSDVKGQSDYKKFEKARELKKHIDTIRKDYKKNLKAELMADRQRATAVYLIDQFALRAGNEKSDDEADTVGCCSLKFEHVTLEPPNKVIFDFLGKDSIRFHEEFEVDLQVFKNLKIFKKSPKKEGDEIFDRLTTSALNKHLSNYMTGLTAKVFRTYNASYTFATLLKELKPGGTLPEKVKDYNDANRRVAILCNHKRTVTAGHADQMGKLQDRIDGVRYQQHRHKLMMLELEPKLKKKKGAEFFELPKGLDKNWQSEHHKLLVEQEREKIRKKFEKENEKLKAEGSKEMKPKELDERMEVADELETKLAQELKKGKVEPEGKGVTVEKLEDKVEKLQARIDTMITQSEDKENNKEVALGTSKINYIDPRLTVVFCKRFDVPIEKFFSKTLREKFQWAIKSVPEDWEF